MSDTIPVTLEGDAAAAAAALAEGCTRATMDRLVSHVLHPRAGPSELAQAIAATKAEARAAGLTDTDINEELDAYNAERRGASMA